VAWPGRRDGRGLRSAAVRPGGPSSAGLVFCDLATTSAWC
jgi:hypothetical protein